MASEQEIIRRKKLQAYDIGINPYHYRHPVNHTLKQIKESFEDG
jgi:lysyl-tRNA synthetase class II